MIFEQGSRSWSMYVVCDKQEVGCAVRGRSCLLIDVEVEAVFQ